MTYNSLYFNDLQSPATELFEILGESNLDVQLTNWQPSDAIMSTRINISKVSEALLNLCHGIKAPQKT